MARLELRNISKRYPDSETKALKGIDLDVPDGSITALLGPSGCGKSTLLRIVAGLEDPDEGELLLDGRPITPLHPSQRGVAMVFQNYALYPHMRVEENIAVGLRLSGHTRKEAKRKALHAASLLGIEDLLDRFPGRLSGGQQQRVAIARAIVKKPALFLLDEPLSNLDIWMREQTRRELKGLFRDLKATVLYVTHDQSEAMTMADSLVVMERGEIRQSGPPDDVYDDPRNRFVADFVGLYRTNMIPGVESQGVFRALREGSEFGARTGTGGTAVAAKTEEAERKKERASLWLTCRPERIRLLPDHEEDPPSHLREEGFFFEGRVEMVDHLGAHGVLHIRSGDSVIRAVTEGEKPPGEGASVRFQIPSGALRLFEGENGMRIRETKITSILL